MRRLILLPLALLLSACLKTESPDLTPSSDQAPTVQPVKCQPTVKAPSQPEPAPPAGLTQDGFYDPLFDFVMDVLGEDEGRRWIEWFSNSHPEWAREGWSRLDKARALPPCS